MSTVWAYRIGAWSESPTTGWSHTIYFGDGRLSTLVDALDDEGQRGRVSRLAIVAHGNSGGLVQLNPALTADSMRTHRADLRRLRSYLTPHGMLCFFSCIAGADQSGSDLLCAVSRELPGRTIVGFVVFGCFSNAFGSYSAPGNMVPSATSACTNLNDTKLSLWDVNAKWAYEGSVVRWPLAEQMMRDGNRCGNPDCPGHASPRDRCTAWAPHGLRVHSP